MQSTVEHSYSSMLSFEDALVDPLGDRIFTLDDDYNVQAIGTQVSSAAGGSRDTSGQVKVELEQPSTQAILYEPISPVEPTNSAQTEISVQHYSPAASATAGTAHYQPSQTLAAATFVKQPPTELRKSNFFNFSLTFSDAAGAPVAITATKFTGFFGPPSGPTIGARYALWSQNAAGETLQHDVYVSLVDSNTKETIIYEGQDKNPGMRRVLLTHETMCTRCIDGKSCGNRNETPSDPQIINHYELRFYLKCNQNCLKTAGNPRDHRRFEVLIQTATSGTPLAYSTEMFVHNNSKHGRKAPKKVKVAAGTSTGAGATDGQQVVSLPTYPILRSIFPTVSEHHGSGELFLIGDHFAPKMIAIFGSFALQTEVITSKVMKVVLPQCTVPGQVNVSVYSETTGTAHGAEQYRYLPFEEATDEEAIYKELAESFGLKGAAKWDILDVVSRTIDEYSGYTISAAPAISPASNGSAAGMTNELTAVQALYDTNTQTTIYMLADGSYVTADGTPIYESHYVSQQAAAQSQGYAQPQSICV